MRSYCSTWCLIDLLFKYVLKLKLHIFLSGVVPFQVFPLFQFQNEHSPLHANYTKLLSLTGQSEYWSQGKTMVFSVKCDTVIKLIHTTAEILGKGNLNLTKL